MGFILKRMSGPMRTGWRHAPPGCWPPAVRRPYPGAASSRWPWSGGSTPLTLFRLLRTEAWAARVDWAHTRVFWVDERCVAPDHPASNYGAANQELLAHVPAAEIYPMDGEIDPGESAVAYEELLRQHVPAEEGMPRLDCALLGMGDDGHTASLFPGSPLLAPEALRSAA